MRGSPFPYLLAGLAVAGVTAITATWLPVLGAAASALLFLLPVLLIAMRGEVGPALFAATGGALAYNFFLLPPRFTFRIHGPDNVVSVLVLFAVALVTSRLATALKAREIEAQARAAASAQAADFSVLLGRRHSDHGLESALDWLSSEFGEVRILRLDAMPVEADGFTTLDLSAAAWAMHNGDETGHGTPIMPAAEWTFLPLSPRRQSGTDLLAVARPASGATRSASDQAQLRALAQMLGQARDHLELEEERRARERLEDRDAFRRALLASLAHDFRTPLTVVTAELAKLAPHDSGAAQALASARRLDRMMDDLIGAARIEGGALSPRLEAVDLVDVLAEARAALGNPPEGVALTAQIRTDLPLIEADPVLLRHIVINLIDNAMRHARAAVTITGRKNEGAVELTIEDDGPGIPVAERSRIFDRFARVEGGDRTGGSGLGLAIARGFADAMGMTIAAEEGKTGGALFRLIMPTRTMDSL